MFNRYADPQKIREANDLLRTVRAAWRDACAFDGFPAEAGLVVFSEENPHAERYNAASAAFLAFRREQNV